MSEERNSDCQSSRPYRLKNAVQNYGWGGKDENAYIANLLGIDPVPGKPYAELWMGVHPKSPSFIIDPNLGPLSLASWISENKPERLSLNASPSFSAGLPYLLKVLSAGEALSIQAHPNKQQAERLHLLDPEHYPDDNHKPEIAVALDHLEALIGFVSDGEFLALLKLIPEIESLINKDLRPASNLKEGIQRLFKIREQDGDSISNAIGKLQERLIKMSHPSESESLFLEQSGLRDANDIGLLFLFFLNRVNLGPGEAVFLAPGVPHAYLKGNIIECMANSDNVVRLGLTDKYCDAKALSEILVYDDLTDYRIVPNTQGYMSEYQSPTKEFRVKLLELPEGKIEPFSGRSSLSMFVVTEGELSLHWGGNIDNCNCVFRHGHAFVTPANLNYFDLRARHDTKVFFVEIPEAEI